MLFWLGIALIVGACGLAIFGSLRKTVETFRFPSFLLAFIGIIMVFGDGVTEVNVPWIGSFKKVTAQALADASVVSELRKRVENQSATVDLIANKASNSEKVAISAAKQVSVAQQKVVELDKVLSDARDTLKILQEEVAFTELVSEAQNDDRHAFDQLKELSNDASNPVAKKATDMWQSILGSYLSRLQLQFSVPWEKGVDPSKLTLWDLEMAYRQAVGQPTRVGMLQNIWSRNDIPVTEKMDFLIDLAENDSSITSVFFALRTFEDTTHANAPPFDISYVKKWWSDHRQEYIGR